MFTSTSNGRHTYVEVMMTTRPYPPRPVYDSSRLPPKTNCPVSPRPQPWSSVTRPLGRSARLTGLDHAQVARRAADLPTSHPLSESAAEGQSAWPRCWPQPLYDSLDTCLCLLFPIEQVTYLFERTYTISARHPAEFESLVALPASRAGRI